MTKTKKRILAVAALVICMAIVGGATYAFWVTQGRARNVITTGKIDITIVEQQEVGGRFVPYPDEPIEAMPSSEVSKIVSVRCEEEEAYVRMKYSIHFRDASGKTLNLDPSIVKIEPTSQNWIEKDGWYYYNTSLTAGEVTEPLFEEVVFDGFGMGNEYMNATVIVRIHAQSVQAKNNAAPDGDVTRVGGWPLF